MQIETHGSRMKKAYCPSVIKLRSEERMIARAMTKVSV